MKPSLVSTHSVVTTVKQSILFGYILMFDRYLPSYMLDDQTVVLPQMGVIVRAGKEHCTLQE